MTKSFEKEKKSNPEESQSSKNKHFEKKPNIVSWLILLFTLTIVVISLISVVFPALIASNNSAIRELQNLGIEPLDIDSFVTGVWAGPLLATNLIILGIAILYYKKKLPDIILRSIHFIFNFEVSKKVSFIIVAGLLVIYIGFSAGELSTIEEWEDYPSVKKRVDGWSFDQVVLKFEPHVRYFLIWSSVNLFGYYTIIPFLASISLLLLTYFFTVKITNKRFAGIVAMVILLQSNVFLTYDSTVAYTNFWTLFYLLSLYFIYKAWPLSPVSYLLSIPSKPLTAMFFPMSLFFILRADISKNKKIIIAASTCAIILAGGLASASGFNLSAGTGSQEEFNSDEFWLGFTSFSYQLRFDGLVLVFILPLMVGLFIASRKGILHADSFMVLIAGILLTAPILTGFTVLTNQPYRFIPLIVFFAIGVGVLLSKRKEITLKVE